MVRVDVPCMERALRHLLSAAFRFRNAGLLIVVSVTAVAAYLLTAVSFDSNVLNLLPERGPALRGFRTYLQTFGNLDRVYIAFESPDGQVIADYDAAVDQYVNRLRALPEIQHVDAGLDDPGKDWSYLVDRQLLLLDDASVATAVGRLEPVAMSTALERARERLAVPGPDVRRLVQEDPLGWLLLMRNRLGSEGLPIGLTGDARGYVSEDGRSRLVIARPRRPPQDTAFARRLNAALDRITTEVTANPENAFGDALPPLTVEQAGGYRTAPEVEELIRREGVRNGLTSFITVAILVVAVFRSFRPLVLISVPILVAGLVTVAVYGSIRPLSTAASGSAAMLLGLGVDGTLLLYIGYLAGMRRGLDSHGAIVGLGAAAVSLTTGFTTTAATFFGLVPIDFPALAELGRIIGLGILLCGVFTLVLVPALVPRHLPPAHRRRIETPWLYALVERRRRAILAIAAGLSIVLGIAAADLRIVPTVDKLQARTAGSESEESIARRFSLPRDTVLVLAAGRDLEALLEASRRLDAALRAAPAVPVSSPVTFLPPAGAQTQRAELLRQTVPSTDVLGATLERTAARAGFRPGAFDRFVVRLPRLLDSDQRLTPDGYREHGLSDLIDRYVQRDGDLHRIVTYVYPRDDDERARVEALVAELGPPFELTGLPAVNAELARRFWPTFAIGAVLGTIGVVAIIVVAFRSLRLALLALLPTALGILWSAGLLAVGRVELDLFSVFALLMSVGIGVDYGIHVLHRRMSPGGLRAALTVTAPAILLAAASTVLGFGSLAFSSYAPLRLLGIVAAVTVSACLVTSLLVLPAVLGDGA